MAISYRASSAANNKGAPTSTLAITKPTGTVAGDFLIGVFTAPQVTITNPSGWTNILTQSASSGARIQVAYKVAGGAEGASYSFTVSGSTTTLAGSIMCLSGVDTTTPIDTSASNGAVASSATTPNLTGVDATDMIVLVGGARPEASSSTNATTGPTTGGWTTPASAKSGAGDGSFPSSSAMAYRIAGASGFTGTFTTNVSSGLATGGIAINEGIVIPDIPDSVGILLG